VTAQAAATTPAATATATTDSGTNWIVIGALVLAGFSVLAVVIVFFLPTRV